MSEPRHTPMDAAAWQGRVDDAETGDSRRWHQVVRPLRPGDAGDGGAGKGDGGGVALLGLCIDEGVRRNQGRPGACRGPAAIRGALAGLAWHGRTPLFDAGDLQCVEEDLEAFAERQADRVRDLLDAGHLPLLLGGGHEIAWGNYTGLARHLDRAGWPEGPVGILNFDAHFDLRAGARPTSGTPFRQIAEDCAAADRPFRYACVGVAEPANTRALYERAERLGVAWLPDTAVTGWNLDANRDWLTRFIQPLDALYLTVCLDVLPAATAPGVSAPAARGVALPVLESLIMHALETAGPRLRLVDLAEMNPDLDIDGRTARVAARLCHQVVMHQNRV